MIGNEVKDLILKARKELDYLNQHIADYRSEKGMSPELRRLYAKMGRLDAALEGTLQLADLTQEVTALPR